jgi:hypothetical protein
MVLTHAQCSYGVANGERAAERRIGVSSSLSGEWSAGGEARGEEVGRGGRGSRAHAIKREEGRGSGGRGWGGARWPAMKSVVNGGGYRLRERGNGREEVRGASGIEEDGGRREEGGERAREKQPERAAWSGKAERLEVGEGADGRARGVSKREGGREGEMGRLGRNSFLTGCYSLTQGLQDI